MQFWKMNGAGNDFIILNNMTGELPAESYPLLARTLCERHLSLGADGLMIVEKAVCGGDFRMIFYNSDGSEGEMCGNGARCISRYGYENGLSGERQTVETVSGTVSGERLSAREYRIELTKPSVIDLDREVTLKGIDLNGKPAESFRFTCPYVELGDPGLPHAVVEIPGLKDFPEDALFRLGRALRYNEAFPKGANVNFFEIQPDGTVFERTYERGVEDFTYACGTGTGSVAAVLTLEERMSGSGITVDMTGGRLIIDIIRDPALSTGVSHIFLTGPTNIVAAGEIRDEELKL